MRCRAIAAKLDAYVDGELAERDRQRVVAHLAACESCAQRYADLAGQVGLIESLPRVAPSADLRRRIMAALPERPVSRRTRPRVFAWRPALAAVVIGAIIAAVLWLAPWRGEEKIVTPTPRPGPSVTEETQKPPEAPEVAVSLGPPPEAPAPEAPRKRESPPKEPQPRPAEMIAAAPEVYRSQAAEYEREGRLAEALTAYQQADAEEKQASSVDVARVYERMGYTADAVDRYADLAFAAIPPEASNSNGG